MAAASPPNFISRLEDLQRQIDAMLVAQCDLRRLLEEPAPPSFQSAPAETGLPHQHVGAIVLVGDRIALRSTRERIWVLPKATPAIGETLEQAVLRAIREQIGLGAQCGPAVANVRHTQCGQEQRVTYYLCWLEAPQQVKSSIFLLRPEDALARLTHQDERSLLVWTLQLEEVRSRH